MSKDIFISYARENEGDVRRLVKELENRGVSCWIDTKDLLAGERFSVKITDAIRACDYFLCVLSSQAMESPGYRHREIRQAIEFAKTLPPDKVYILPIRLEECEIPYDALLEFNIVNMYPSWKDGVSRIVETVEYYRENRSFLVEKKEQKTEKAIKECEVRTSARLDEQYERFVTETYRKYLNKIRRDASLAHVCQQAGMVYRDIYERNCEIGLSKIGKYDHNLVFYIAGWIIEHIDNFSIHNMNQEHLAREITDQILDYLASWGRPEGIFLK